MGSSKNIPLSLAIITLIVIVHPIHAQVDRRVDRLVIPFDAANSTIDDPYLYKLERRHIANWIVAINNNLIYNPESSDAIVLRFRNAFNPGEFLELGMRGQERVLWFAISKESIGYTTIYKNSNAWFPERAVMMTYAQGERLSINNGQRIIIDRLSIGQFAIEGVEVYGRDGLDAPYSALAGVITIEVMSGNPLDNPIMSVPFIVTGAVAGIVFILLKLKRRDKDTEQSN